MIASNTQRWQEVLYSHITWTPLVVITWLWIFSQIINIQLICRGLILFLLKPQSIAYACTLLVCALKQHITLLQCPWRSNPCWCNECTYIHWAMQYWSKWYYYTYYHKHSRFLMEVGKHSVTQDICLSTNTTAAFECRKLNDLKVESKYPLHT